MIWLPPADRSRRQVCTGPGSGSSQPASAASHPVPIPGARGWWPASRPRLNCASSGAIPRQSTSAISPSSVSRRALPLARAEYRILTAIANLPAGEAGDVGVRTIFVPPGPDLPRSKMLGRCSTNFHRWFAADLVPSSAVLASRGFRSEFDYDEYQVAAMRAALECAHPAVLLFPAPVLHRRRGGTGVRQPVTASTCSAASTCRSVSIPHGARIFIRQYRQRPTV